MSLASLAHTPTSPVPRPPWSGDEVVQLRVWASEQTFPIFAESRKLAIGTAPSCAIQVHDIASFVSREHAYLEREANHWCIVDRSKNGLYLDGARYGKAHLLPGMRVGLGPHVTLVAESARTIALRAALARMMGWSTELADALDVAFQNLRFAVAGRAVFMLCGDGDLLELAQELHQIACGQQRPLVLCSTGSKRRQSSDHEAVAMDALKRVSSGREALRLAPGGTICLDNRRLPRDLIPMLEQLRDTRGLVQTLVIVLSKYVRKTEVFTPTPVAVPLLSTRKREIERLFVEYETLSTERLHIAPLHLEAAQRQWIREHCETLSDFKVSVLRLIALRHAGSAYGAAGLLKMSCSGLRQWFAARGLAQD